jgi:uncharacterized membrane protein YfcA
MDWTVPVLGFLVGFLVGLTGIGGGSLMTPLLILVGGVRPIVAVGTDLAYAAITKAVGAAVHWRQGTVDLRIAWRLGIGSIPAALAGVAFIVWIKGGAENGALDRFITQALAVALILVASNLLLRPFAKREPADAKVGMPGKRQKALTILAGAGIGLLVGLTSVGSGALIAGALVMLYPRLPLSRVVGTDVFHATFLLAAAALAHFGLGSIDVALLGPLLIGSLPGVWLGSRLAVTVPDRVLRPILAILLLGVAYKLL